MFGMLVVSVCGIALPVATGLWLAPGNGQADSVALPLSASHEGEQASVQAGRRASTWVPAVRHLARAQRGAVWAGGQADTLVSH